MDNFGDLKTLYDFKLCDCIFRKILLTINFARLQFLRKSNLVVTRIMRINKYHTYIYSTAVYDFLSSSLPSFPFPLSSHTAVNVNFGYSSYTFLESAGTAQVGVVKAGNIGSSFSVRVYGGDERKRRRRKREMEEERDRGRQGEMGGGKLKKQEEGKREGGREGGREGERERERKERERGKEGGGERERGGWGGRGETIPLKHGTVCPCMRLYMHSSYVVRFWTNKRLGGHQRATPVLIPSGYAQRAVYWPVHLAAASAYVSSASWCLVPVAQTLLT